MSGRKGTDGERLPCRLLVFMLLMVSISSCTYLRGYVDIFTDKGPSSEYLDVLDQWTRGEIVYSQFETKIHIRATYKTPEFQRAYEKEYARLYNLSEEEQKKRADIQGQMTDFVEFLFYASMQDRETNDFDRSNSIWTLYLINEKNERINPIEIRRMEKVPPVLQTFYPYINPYYGMCYRLKFPPLPQQKMKPLKIVITGVLGKATLEWK